MVERARRLDPLEPAHDVTKAVFLMYDRGDVVGAESLLRNVLQRQPQYVPALVRLGELDMCCRADPSEAVELLERAIALDPGMHWPRRVLLRSYLNAGDVAAAESVATDSPGPQEVLQLVLLVRKADWLNAGEVAYDALMQRQVAPIDEPVAVFAIRRHARLTGDYMRAGAALTGMSNTTWGADGAPSVPAKPGVRAASLGLADLLQQTGDPARTRALLDEVLGQMGAELRSPGRFPTWYYSSMGLARALRGESAQALAWLQRGADAGTMLHDWDLLTGSEPAFDPLRGTAEFDALRARVKAHAARERAELDALRAQGRIPRRDGASAK
jgi:ATP/maltotriose-dependent transcriptional regulator MalT